MWGLYQKLESCSIRLSTDTYLAVMFAAVKVSNLGKEGEGVGLSIQGWTHHAASIADSDR